MKKYIAGGKLSLLFSGRGMAHLCMMINNIQKINDDALVDQMKKVAAGSNVATTTDTRAHEEAEVVNFPALIWLLCEKG